MKIKKIEDFKEEEDLRTYTYEYLKTASNHNSNVYKTEIKDGKGFPDLCYMNICGNFFFEFKYGKNEQNELQKLNFNISNFNYYIHCYKNYIQIERGNYPHGLLQCENLLSFKMALDNIINGDYLSLMNRIKLWQRKCFQGGNYVEME